MGIIKKDYPLASVEISNNEKNSSIWVNSLNGCVIRISNLKINDDFDKFGFIDINNSNGKCSIIEDENDSDKDLRNFLLALNKMVLNELQFGKLDYDLIKEIRDLIREKKDGEK